MATPNATVLIESENILEPLHPVDLHRRLSASVQAVDFKCYEKKNKYFNCHRYYRFYYLSNGGWQVPRAEQIHCQSDGQ